MKVVLARNAGFCMGVRRAVETTLDMVREAHGSIATYGPLIHNPQVLDILGERGVKVLDRVPQGDSPGTVIIRAHGIPPEEKEAIGTSGATVKDATCPRVQKVQAIIRRHLGEGATAAVIIGDRNHAEVDGLMGYAGERGVVVSNGDDVARLNISGPYIIVSQTTQDQPTFDRLSSLILERFPGGRVFSTICDSTHKRQSAVLELCDKVDAMVVVGGRTGANTKRLGEIVEGRGKPVFVVENEEELSRQEMRRFRRVGVTAGASTPSWIIERVIRFLELIPGEGENPLISAINRMVAACVSLSLYAAAGAGLMTLAIDRIRGVVPHAAHFFIAFAYIFAVYNLNRLMSRPRPQYIDPLRRHFVNRRRPILWTLAIAATIAALFLSFTNNRQGAILLIMMVLAGTLYNVRLIPAFLSRAMRFRRLREIPGSKTLFSAVAWVMVMVVVTGGWNPADLPIMAVLFLLIFYRNGLYDLMDMQGDRIMGRETLPVSMGEAAAARLLWSIMAIGAATSLFFAAFYGSGLYGYTLFAAWLFLGLVHVLFRSGRIRHGFGLELLIDTVFPTVWLMVQLIDLIP